MEPNGWLKTVLDHMRDDIDEIRSDLKDIKDFKLKIINGVFIISTIVTLVINAIALIWFR